MNGVVRKHLGAILTLLTVRSRVKIWRECYWPYCRESSDCFLQEMAEKNEEKRVTFIVRDLVLFQSEDLTSQHSKCLMLEMNRANLYSGINFAIEI